MNAPPNLSKIELLRAHHGDSCWLCDGKLDFTAEPNSKKAPTREHLVAKSLGGSDVFDNLVLCHPGCNRQLGNRSKDDKLKIKAKLAANRAKQALKAKPVPKTALTKTLATKALVVASPYKRPMTNWQQTAMIATASATFFAGLCLGLLVR